MFTIISFFSDFHLQADLPQELLKDFPSRHWDAIGNYYIDKQQNAESRILEATVMFPWI